MILWTIQSIKAWEELQQRSVLYANPRYVDNDFLPAYGWMTEQMRKRLGMRPSEDSLPLWAWYQWEDERSRRPDLRSSGHLPKGEPGVRIEFEIEDNLVLLSDFELWHYVLNYWYLPTSEAEGESFEAELANQGLSFYETKPLPNPIYHKRIEKNWERIFDMEWAPEGIASPTPEKSIQATFWELCIDDVKSC